jgi:hypothetical protein
MKGKLFKTFLVTITLFITSQSYAQLNEGYGPFKWKMSMQEVVNILLSQPVGQLSISYDMDWIEHNLPDTHIVVKLITERGKSIYRFDFFNNQLFYIVADSTERAAPYFSQAATELLGPSFVLNDEEDTAPWMRQTTYRTNKTILGDYKSWGIIKLLYMPIYKQFKKVRDKVPFTLDW